MGHEGIEAVLDAGPILHLAEIDGLSLLSVFSRLHLPQAVWQETVGLSRISEADMLLLPNGRRHFPSRQDVEEFVNSHGLEKLHAGEQDCLYLCRQAGIQTILSDDLAVREAAKRLLLTPVGSLGVVVRAYWINRITLSQAKQYLAELYEISSLFVTREIITLAIEQLQEHPRNT